MSGVARDVASFLPWGMDYYEADNSRFRDPPKPLKHPDWYKLEYKDKGGNRRSLAQIMYETMGAILPRDLDLYDDAHNMLRKFDIRGKNEILMTELMTTLYYAEHQTKLPIHYDEVVSAEPAEDIDALKEQMKVLRTRLKKVTDDAHELDRRARKAEQALEQERIQTGEDRRELAALREVIFMQDSTADESVSITLPYQVKQRIVIYGGHYSWLKGMKEYLTGDIRYIDKDQAIIDRNIIRNADVVRIQTNAISHRQYYAVIDEVRKAGAKVRYFTFASAKKCAEQVATEE